MKNATTKTTLFTAILLVSAATLVNANGTDSIGPFGEFCCAIKQKGGAGGVANRVAAFNMTPVVGLAQSDSRFTGIVFPSLMSRYHGLSMSGGFGYGGIGNGVRIGAAWYSGSTKFFSTPDAANAVTALQVYTGTGGLLIEKMGSLENWNVFLGSIIGGGWVSVGKTTAYDGEKSLSSDNWVFDRNNNAIAGILALELHGGATYSILPWMHIGGEVSATSYYSNGFSRGTGAAFFGILPQIGFRLAFGNLG